MNSQQKLSPDELKKLRQELILIRRDTISVLRSIEALLELPDHMRLIKPPSEKLIDKKP